MNRYVIAQYIALGATALSVIGLLLGSMSGTLVGGTLGGIGIIAGFVSYIFAGLWTAIKMAGGIAKWGWFVVPFPYDLMTFLVAFVISIYVFILFPIIPVRKAYNEGMRY